MINISKPKLYDGKSLQDWSRETGIKAGTIYARLKSGVSLLDAISMPVKSPSETSTKYYVLGNTYKDRFGNEYKVTERVENSESGTPMYKCEFIKSGYKTIASVSQIIGKNSHVFDRYSSSVHGVGALGNAHAKDNKKLYEVWRAMIARCYNKRNPSYKTYGGKGIIVCDKWKRFDLFLEDAIFIPGYNQEKIDKGQLVLDKDIINHSAMKYSPETCCFVTRSENTKESSTRRWNERNSVETIS